ncbi:MAG: type III-B CRISPR module RAMP protein Cmr1 [Candidatus Contendobacter sp.]|nr:type III-B CRISPR module RAMP protein Cmr1 [Candidatus Contendobacter sp.]MDG4557000.1 type III-B CRISPR module RAMP protein Cmr1 [Candidatus Contendobacter sp.]
MKLRTPSNSPPSEPIPATLNNNRRSFQVTTITPVYGGGITAGEPDAEMPVRASTIRGQLRFWWRLLNRQRFSNPQNQFEAERDIWGGMSDKQDRSSKVQIRITSWSGGAPRRFQRAQEVGIPPYAIAVALTGRDNNEVLTTGLNFTLMIRCPDTLWGGVEETLRWWASFGGLGARTRRGLGALQIAGLTTVSTVEEASSKGCRLILKGSFPQAHQAWKTAIEALQTFRQGEGFARRPRGPGATVPGRSHWPEPDSIRDITRDHRVKADGTSFAPVHPARIAFPRAYFGLPILFHFKNIKRDNPPNERRDLHFDPRDTTLVPAGEGIERMASPLILKPLALSDGQYAACALTLPTEHLNRLALVLRRGDTPLQTFPAGNWWPTGAAGARAKAADIRPMQDRDATDPLTAFLDYFEKGR